MPHFAWEGITLAGQNKKGRLFARSVQELDAALFKRDIALLTSKPTSPALFVGSIKVPVLIKLYQQLATLLHAGVLLPQALVLVTEQFDHPRLQEILHAISNDVAHGISLHEAMGKYPQVFDALTNALVYVGQESGNLVQSFRALAEYCQDRHAFYQKLRSAAVVPCITLVFFVLVTVVIFVGVIPQFQTIFAAVGHELPPLTQAMVTISAVVRSGIGLWIAGGVIGGFLLLRHYFSSESGRATKDALYVRIPGIKTIIIDSSLCHFMRCTAVLLDAGLPLVAAITLAKKTIVNQTLQQQLAYLEHELESGLSLGQAMAHHPQQLFDQMAIAAITVAQESAQMSSMLVRAASEYQERVNRTLMMLTTLFQPLLMVVLGVLVMLLIVAVYLPIISLSTAVR